MAAEDTSTSHDWRELTKHDGMVMNDGEAEWTAVFVAARFILSRDGRTMSTHASLHEAMEAAYE